VAHPEAIRAQILLCDAAQVIADKFYILGGGWTYLWIAPGTPQYVVAAIDIIVPWNLGNRRLQVSLDLITEDGEQVMAFDSPPDEPEVVMVDGTIVAGRGPMTREGADLHVPLAIPFRPVVFEPGGYVCELRIREELITRMGFQVAAIGEGGAA
jgi:hypothetical protein